MRERPDVVTSRRRGPMRRLAVLLLGLAMIAGGVVLLVLPGPGLLLIVGGLALLGTEFEIARRARRRLIVRGRQTAARLRGSADGSTIPPSQHPPAVGGMEPPLSPPH